MTSDSQVLLYFCTTFLVMLVHKDIDHLPAIKNAVVTIGTFDGVHLGHLQIIDQLKKEATAVNGETVIITFHPHPRSIVGRNGTKIYLINTLDEKIELLEKHGIDHLVVVPFTETFASQTAQDYVEDFLVKKFHPHTLIIGYDHRFGKNRTGDFHLLEDYAKKGTFKLIEITEKVLQEAAVSSTRIREALLQGEIETANELLGYNYFFEGTVVEGNKLGRTIGYPTANLRIENEDKLVPGNGVYAVYAAVLQEGKRDTQLKGMMNIGNRPTVDGSKRVIEVNLFDFDQDIYGQTLRVSLVQYQRGEVKFNGLDALKEQLAKDKLTATGLLT